MRMRTLIHITVFLLAEIIRESRGDVISDCAGKPADVIFVLDASNSIWRPDFQRQLNFIKDVVEFFTIGTSSMMVGVITYARNPQLQFNLNSYNRKSDLLAAIDVVQQDGGYETITSDALRYLRERGFSANYGSRQHVAKVAVLITDGRSDNTTLSALEAAKVKANGIHLFAVGVGRNLDMEELKALASDPDDYYTFLVDNYGGLERIKDLLAIKTCSVTDPPSTTTTTTTTTTTPSVTTMSTRHTIITKRPRRIKTTTTYRITTTTTSEPTTTLTKPKHIDHDDNDDEHDDSRNVHRENKIAGADSDSTNNKDLDSSEKITDNDPHLTGDKDLHPPSDKNTDTPGHKNYSSSSKIADSNPHLTGSKEWNSTNEGGTNGGNSSEFEIGRELIGAENLERGFGKYRITLEDLVAGQSTPEIVSKDFDRPTVRFESPRTPEILEPPIYVPDSTRYPYHELKANNFTFDQRPGNGRPGTSEYERRREEDLVMHRRKPPPGSSEGSDEDTNGQNGKELVIYAFNTDGHFVRVDGSQYLVDVDQLPKVPEDGDIFVEGNLIVTRDALGRRKDIGCVINGTYYIGKWMADNGKNLWYGYRAPEIADRIRDGTSHAVESAERRLHASDDSTDGEPEEGADGDSVIPEYSPSDVDTDLNSIYNDYLEGDGREISVRRRNKTDAENPFVDEEDRGSEAQILDPKGNSGYWEEDKNGQRVWYLYTCPGVYVPVSDGPPLDENGKPQLNGESQCAGQDENGQDVEYVYVSPGQFEMVLPTSSSGVQNAHTAPVEEYDEGKYHAVGGKEESRWVGERETGADFSQDGVDRFEVDGPEQSGVWTIDVDGTLKPIRNELVDLKLPKIDEDNEFYVKENVIWTKGKGGKLKPVGCIINGTYYVGYWIRKGDGSRLLYGYPSKNLEQKLSHQPPSELTHGRLRERLPAVEHDGDGHWTVDEHGVLTWFARVSDDDTSLEKQEFKIGERSGGYGQLKTELDRTPGPDAPLENTTPDEENADRRKIVLDSNGQTGTWKPDEQGEWVWHRYVCPGVYEPVPERSLTTSGEEERTNECIGTGEDGQEVKFEYEGPGQFRQIPKEIDSGDKKGDEKSRDNQTKDSKNSRESEGRDIGRNKTRRGSTRVPNSEFLNRHRTTSKPVHIDTETTKRTKSTSLNGHTNETNGKSSGHKGCRPRKPIDLAFMIDSKRDDETSVGHMWNLTRDILSRLDVDDGRVRVRFVEECGGPGASGLDLGDFESKEHLIRALDASIHAPPTSSAQLIRSMAEVLSRDDDGDATPRGVNGRGRRRVGVYMTDGSSDVIQETVEAAQKAKLDDDVEMFSVGVGGRVNPTELRAIASCEVDRHYHAMNHHSKADAIAKKISKVICLGR